jgi:LmbE family N-acetylglucosaminyl deacetylase
VAYSGVAKRVLVFGAHADDETIGAGGTIALLSELGYEVYVATFCWSSVGDWGDTGYARVEWKGSIAEMRRSEALDADKVLGVRERFGFGIPTQGVVNDRATYQRAVELIRRVKPIAIFTHYWEDKHRDHRAVSQITEEAWWKASESVLADLGEPWRAKALFFYEVFELFTRPTHVCDVTATFQRKLDALRCFKSQEPVLGDILGYVEGLARARGYLAGAMYGEAFLRSAFMPGRLEKELESLEDAL